MRKDKLWRKQTEELFTSIPYLRTKPCGPRAWEVAWNLGFGILVVDSDTSLWGMTFNSIPHNGHPTYRFKTPREALESYMAMYDRLK